jgi:hypothetical protein
MVEGLLVAVKDHVWVDEPHGRYPKSDPVI